MGEELVQATPSAEVAGVAPEQPVAQAQAEVTPVVEKPKYKIKGVKGEREVDVDELVVLAQKGDDYDRVKQNWEKHHDDAEFVSKLAKTYGMDPAEYRKQALAELERQAVQQYVDKGMDETLAKEVVETKRFQSDLKEQLAAKEKEDVLRSNYEAFGKEYPDVKPADIPLEVWKDFDKGIPLVTAYAAHDRTRLAKEMEELKSKIIVQKKNDESAASSPGSVSDAPGSAPAFVTEEQFMAMSRTDRVKNYDMIAASMKKW